VIDGDV